MNIRGNLSEEIMGKIGLAINLAKRTANFVKNSGKTSLIQTKPQMFKKGTVLAYEPKYNKAVKYYVDDILQDTHLRNPHEVESLARQAVNNDMKTWGRVLEFGKEEKPLFDLELLNFPPGKYDWYDGAISCAMNITKKARYTELTKTNPVYAQRMRSKPELFKLDEAEAYAKKLLDKAFSQIKPTKYDSIEFRGVKVAKDSEFHKNFEKLKKGDIITEPGYIWTSENRGYAFGNYADKADDKVSIKYHMLMPKGTKEIRMYRHHNENLTPYNSQYRVCGILESGNCKELFLEHIPTKL